MKNQKRKAYDKAVKQTIEVALEHYRKMIGEVVDPEDYLNREIKYLTDRLNENTSIVQFFVQRNRYDFTGFTEKKCKEILTTDKPEIWDISWRDKKDNEQYYAAENKVFKLTVDLKLKGELEKLRSLADKIKLAKVFSREVFEPKSHSRKMIEDWLISWVMNQDKTWPRAEAIKELETKYPELSNMKEGEVINNWRDNFKEFYKERTGKPVDS